MNAAEYADRRRRFLGALESRKLDGALVTAVVNVRYLTGFTGSNALLLLTPRAAVLWTDPRYGIQAAEETSCRVRVARGALTKGLRSALRNIKRLGFENSRLSYDLHGKIRDELPLGVSLEPMDSLLEDLRLLKSSGEIEAIRGSVETCSAAFDRAMKRARAGMKELDLAAEIDYQMRRLGAEQPAFETIVASGPRAALPHARPTTGPIARNRLLLIDMGASRGGYASDMTRMACFGHPSPKGQRLYRAVREAQTAAVRAVGAGVTAGSVDRAARSVLKRHGLDRAFVHSTGHGLGLEIHEAPRLGKGVRTRLEAGIVVTIEPGAYLEGEGGVRIEDTVLVTAQGCEVLTPTPKELLILE